MQSLIKGKSGETKAILKESPNKLILTDKSGAMLGSYDKDQNKTFSRSGAMLGQGNMLAYLLPSE